MRSREHIGVVLRKLTLLTDEEIVLAISFLKKMKLSPNACFQKEGHQVVGIGFLAKGIMKEVVTNSEGNQTVLRFIEKGEFVVDFAGYSFQRPASVGLYASTCCKLLFIDRVTLERLKTLIPQLETVITKVAAIQMDKHKKEQCFLRTGNSSTHYHHFITHFSSVARKVSSADISSYLNVTPSSLSRIKRSYFKEKRQRV